MRNSETDNIIKVMFATGLIQSECEKVCKDANFREDLVQEVTLIMLQKPASLISSLNKKGELLFYIHKVAKNQYCSKTSPFFTMYKKFSQKFNNNKIDDEENI